MTLKNNDDKRFQYTVTLTLNNQQISKYQKRITKIKLLLMNVIGRK